jgi:hypothetical protein
VFSTLLGVFGAITSTIIAYILPTFYYMRTSRQSFVNDKFSWVALALLVVGGSAGLVRRSLHRAQSRFPARSSDFLFTG